METHEPVVGKREDGLVSRQGLQQRGGRAVNNEQVGHRERLGERRLPEDAARPETLPTDPRLQGVGHLIARIQPDHQLDVS
ncbi:MAG TPA: hypothetical protein DDX89_02490 [Candidatus Omnitrophica bacterium]|nr:hypothetical protein [Candidatus Omnitrophota bacterium]